MPDSWEARHAAWRAAGNICRECDRCDQRSLHREAQAARRSALSVDRARRRDGAFDALLRRGARLFGIRHTARDLEAGAAATRELARRRLAHTDHVRRLRVNAEAASVVLEGLRVRGPVWSRPAWEAECRDAGLVADAAWEAYHAATNAELRDGDIVGDQPGLVTSG